MSRSRHVPQRLCMGCGRRGPQSTLTRIAGGPSGLRYVRPGDGGRSGYLHADAACWQRFAARKGPLRSLGCSVDKMDRVAFIERMKGNEVGVR